MVYIIVRIKISADLRYTMLSSVKSRKKDRSGKHVKHGQYDNGLLFTPFPVTRYAMHRLYANRIKSRGMSRVFCDLRSQKTPRGILPVNSNN